MSVSLQITADKNRPDMGLFTEALHKKSKKIWNMAITVYIKAVAEVLMEHQETSMSYASLFATARKVGALGKIPSASPVIDGKRFSDSTQGGYAGAWKSQLLGEAAGEKCSKISYGAKGRPILSFQFHLSVYQYLMHELGGDFDPKTAWNSLQAGQQAMHSFLVSTNFSNIFPRFHEYFTKLTPKVY